MPLLCAQCQRVNPMDAFYCYYDGTALAGRAGGPVHPGSAPFPTPFVFPGGQSCKNFDQLATVCQEYWKEAVTLLKQGFLYSFLGGIGRVDLAMVAKEAAEYPDADRGLDQLLAKLPTFALQPPKLLAEPSEIHLGQLTLGQDRDTEIHLTNLGMRLLYGSVHSDSPWLVFGEGPGQSQKMFQFGHELKLPVHLKGQHLRASHKPLIGKLHVDSNGGTATLQVRVEVPIKAFEGGLFDGCVTPREIAERAKAQPKVATTWFEDGSVARWYARNGWNYPVQGPTMPGWGGIQQFFEALGVAKPPKVVHKPDRLDLAGQVGSRVEALVEVSSSEKKVVYGWAVCEKPWVHVGKTQMAGQTAKIPVTIPSVPNHAGPPLETTLVVFGNGNQKFMVPLRLTVHGGTAPYEEPAETMTFEAVTVPEGGGVSARVGRPMTMEPPAEFTPIMEGAATAEFTAVASPETESFEVVPASTKPIDSAKQPWNTASFVMHALPMIFLGLVLFAGLIRDYVFLAPEAETTAVPTDVDPRPVLGLAFDYNFKGKGSPQRLTDSLTFGLVAYDVVQGKKGPKKALTRSEWGFSNRTVVKIDKQDLVVGKKQVGRWNAVPKESGSFGGKIGTFRFPQENIEVTQDVKIVPGEPIQIEPGNFKRLLDTCLVHYRIVNADTKPHTVGLRIIIDTYIGTNDGVPFTLPGDSKLVSSFKEFRSVKEVPDFIQALENPNLKDPGTILQVNLKTGSKREAPDRVLLTRHPQVDAMEKWIVPLMPIKAGDDGDSAVVLYWSPKELPPGGSRDVGFSIGRGDVSVGESANLGLTVGGSPVVRGELTAVALVADRNVQSATLELPPGLTLIDEKTKTQAVAFAKKGDDAGDTTPVTWRLRADQEGTFTITVRTDTGISQQRRITIRRVSLF